MKCDPTVCRTVRPAAARVRKMHTKAPIATQCGDTAKSEKLTEGRSSFRGYLDEAARKDIQGAFLLHKETRLWAETSHLVDLLKPMKEDPPAKSDRKLT